MGKAVPEYVIASVPLVVIGPPDTVRKAGTVALTEVTVPLYTENAPSWAALACTVIPFWTRGIASVPVRALAVGSWVIVTFAIMSPVIS
jgi:hypothetical protein